MKSADIIQLIALPIEVCGLIITIIELQREQKKVYFEKQFVFLQHRLNAVPQRTLNIVLGTLVIGLLFPFFFFTSLASRYPERDYQVFYEAPIYLLVIIILFYFANRALSKSLGNGRQLLAFGVALSFAGLMCELIQVFSIEF